MMLEAIFHLRDPSPVAFQNVYEDGDRWEKIRGCEDCEHNCCGTCRMIIEGTNRCYLHMVSNGDYKPFHCCIRPTPQFRMNECMLAWKCTKGGNAGKYRYKCDPDGTFRSKSM